MVYFRGIGNVSALPGEKRIYAVNAEDGTVAGEVYLKNDGVIEINNAGDLKIVAYGNVSVITPGNVDVSAASVNVAASVVNLGEGGAGIARLGDEVTVEVTGGSSAGTYKGTITSAGVNTSI